MKKLKTTAFLASLFMLISAGTRAQNLKEPPQAETDIVAAAPNSQGTTFINPPPPPFLSEEQNTQAFSLYPNPGQGIFYLKSLSGQPIRVIRIYDLTGQLLHSYAPEPSSATYQVDLSANRAGVYLIHLGNKVLKYQKH